MNRLEKWFADGLKADPFCAPAGDFKMPTSFPQDSKALMTGYSQTTNKWNPSQIASYLRMTVEEVCEAIEAANPAHKAEIAHLCARLQDLCHCPQGARPVELFDASIDIIVTALGLGHSAGFPMQQGWDEVLGSNLQKIDQETGRVLKDENGKVMKPKGWKAPNLTSVMSRYSQSQDEAL